MADYLFSNSSCLVLSVAQQPDAGQGLPSYCRHRIELTASNSMEYATTYLNFKCENTLSIKSYVLETEREITKGKEKMREGEQPGHYYGVRALYGGGEIFYHQDRAPAHYQLSVRQSILCPLKEEIAVIPDKRTRCKYIGPGWAFPSHLIGLPLVMDVTL
ncbi:hypothetical protein C0J52_25249 [Blattella germanica]|nr:hypothetical protein C0J52_25249 [Blattella germanica]